MQRHRARSKINLGHVAIGIAAGIMLIAIAAVVASCVSSSKPARRAQDPWCVDQVRRIRLEDITCYRDADGDGYADGSIYFPLPGMVRPPVGGALPAGVKLDGSTHRRIDLTLQPVPPSGSRSAVPGPAGPSARPPAAGSSTPSARPSLRPSPSRGAR